MLILGISQGEAIKIGDDVTIFIKKTINGWKVYIDAEDKLVLRTKIPPEQKKQYGIT